ncbi:MAG: prolipoprotein diacylglyceryl transferase [Ruminococcaceae bacterium]|nr:prolipoprotein diacylglyceryl transferase [Oscillospiraceae bacterium]
MFPGIQIGPLFLSSYGICAIIGIFTACPLAIHIYKKHTGDYISMVFMFMLSAIGVFVGMHILFGITNIQYWRIFLNAADFFDFWKRFGLLFGGSVFYGGLIGGLIAGGIFIKIRKMPVDIATDCGAMVIPLFHGFARIGCFFGGCCYGIEWEHGVTFTNSIVESANGVPRVPIQLIEAGFEFLLFAVIFILLTKTNKLRGGLLGLYLLVYPVGRFILEFWRGDEYRGFIFGLSTSQFISILVFVGAVVFFILRARKIHESV